MSRTLVFIAVAMPFEDIRQVFPKPTPEELFKYLTSHAHLIRGCWVARSEIVHPKHSKSFFTRANGERLAAARNYLVSLRGGGSKARRSLTFRGLSMNFASFLPSHSCGGFSTSHQSTWLSSWSMARLLKKMRAQCSKLFVEGRERVKKIFPTGLPATLISLSFLHSILHFYLVGRQETRRGVAIQAHAGRGVS
jgi:hypothetical protein